MTTRSLHLGSAMIDIICIVSAEHIERMTFANERTSFLMLETGRKVPADSITTHVGGGACNTATCLAHRGWESAVIARTGKDLNADAVQAHLAGHGVDATWLVAAAEAATGTAVMVASHDRNASIFVHRGANEGLRPDDLDPAAFAGRDLVYIAPLSSGSAACLGPAAAMGRRAGAMVAANPGIRQLTGRRAEVMAALAAVDLLSVNRVEAEALIPAVVAAEGAEAELPPIPDGAPPLLARGLTSGGVTVGLLRFLEALRRRGPRWVLLTDGTEGAWLAGPDGVVWHPSIPAEVAGTAGAGDSFTATLAAALAEGHVPEHALAEAAVNAAAVVSRIDTTSGLLDRAALDARMAGPLPTVWRS
jgi:ribokinase